MFADKSDTQDERAKKSLAGLAASLGGNDEEKAFLKGPPPPVEESVWDKTSRELKKNWWMWATVAFVVLLLGSLYMFRDSIYSSDTHGLPVIAVKDDVTESCETQCTEKLEKMKEENANVEGGKGKEIYDTCLAKCVSEEAKDIVEERAKWKKEEEEAEKEEQEEAKEEEEEAKKKKKAREEEEEEDGGNRRLSRKYRLLL